MFGDVRPRIRSQPEIHHSIAPSVYLSICLFICLFVCVRICVLDPSKLQRNCFEGSEEDTVLAPLRILGSGGIPTLDEYHPFLMGRVHVFILSIGFFIWVLVKLIKLMYS